MCHMLPNILCLITQEILLATYKVGCMIALIELRLTVMKYVVQVLKVENWYSLDSNPRNLAPEMWFLTRALAETLQDESCAVYSWLLTWLDWEVHRKNWWSTFLDVSMSVFPEIIAYGSTVWVGKTCPECGQNNQIDKETIWNKKGRRGQFMLPHTQLFLRCMVLCCCDLWTQTPDSPAFKCELEPTHLQGASRLSDLNWANIISPSCSQTFIFLDEAAIVFHNSPGDHLGTILPLMMWTNLKNPL
jgi:hypothetical protein